jgi:tight adherence protein B
VDVEERMPGVARALADAVAAGAALEDAVASVGGSVGGRVGRSLSLVASDCIRGLSVGQALERLCRPPAGAAWEPLATAVELHRRSGGDLPSSLRAVAESSEQLAAARASARAATAQARFTASVVCALPVVFAAGAELLRPGLIGSVVGQPIPALLASVSIVVQIACLMAIRALTAFAAG